MKRIKLALHYQMGLALVLGVTGGVLLGDSFDVWGNFINTPVRDKKKIKKAPVVPFFQYVLAEPPACCQRNNMP